MLLRCSPPVTHAAASCAKKAATLQSLTSCLAPLLALVPQVLQHMLIEPVRMQRGLALACKAFKSGGQVKSAHFSAMSCGDHANAAAPPAFAHPAHPDPAQEWAARLARRQTSGQHQPPPVFQAAPSAQACWVQGVIRVQQQAMRRGQRRKHAGSACSSKRGRPESGGGGQPSRTARLAAHLLCRYRSPVVRRRRPAGVRLRAMAASGSQTRSTRAAQDRPRALKTCTILANAWRGSRR